MVNELQSERNHARIAELMETRAFGDLTLKQQTFVSKFISDGLVSHGHYDATAAAKLAYETKNPQNLGAGLLRVRKIKRVLAIHFRTSPLDGILLDVQMCARRSARLGVGITPKLKRALLAFEKYVKEHNGSQA